MDCRNNRFCKSLSPELRERLCANCSKRSLKKGQIIYRADIENRIVLIVNGVMINEPDMGIDVLEDHDTPVLFISTSGLIWGGDNLFNEASNERYAWISYICLQDTTIAFFNRAFIRNLFETEPEFARAMYCNIVIAAAEACEFAAVLRAPNVEQGVAYLLDYAVRKGFKLTQQQMADITGHNRVSVSRAITSIKAKKPELWDRYRSAHLQYS